MSRKQYGLGRAVGKKEARKEDMTYAGIAIGLATIVTGAFYLFGGKEKKKK